MCKCANKLIHLVFFIAVPILISACGGAPAGDSSGQPSSATANKPELSSSSIIDSSSSITASVSSATTTSAATTASSTSSKTTSSGQSYSRISRANSSWASSQEAPPSFDLIAPESTKLRLYRLSENSITLAWDKSFDNVGVSHYKIERNGELIATVEGSNHIFADQSLSSFTDYSYTITAFDFAGNDSGVSPVLNVRTLGNPDNSQTSSSSLNSSSAIQSSHSSLGSAQSSSKASSLSSSNKSKSSSSHSSTNNQKSLKLTWSHPNQRENGTYLTIDEISGYEIRFKQSTDDNYVYMILTGNRTTSFTTNLIPANSIIEIAVYDTNGLFSAFTPITAEVP